MNETVKKPHPLVRFVLLFSPAEFRRHYSHEIYDDAAHGSLLRVTLDAFVAGVTMRLDDLWRNIRLAGRTLRKSPLFAAASILTIAIAVGLNTAMASVVANILLRPLPYPDSQRLVFVTENIFFGPYTSLSYPDIQDLRRGNTTLRVLSASRSTEKTLLRMGTPEKLDGRLIDTEYFKILGMHPEIGRTLDERDGGRGAMISDRLWRKHFGASLAALGRAINLDGTSYRIVGVVPASFHDLDRETVARSDYWLRIDVVQQRRYVNRGGFNYTAIGVLKPGASLEAARADVARVMANVAKRYAKAHTLYKGSSVLPALQTIVEPLQQVLWLLYASAAIVLIVALVNLANLQLVRLTARDRDLTVRAWLGASKQRLAGELAAETAIVAVCGAIVGIALANVAIPFIGTLGADKLPRWDAVTIDLPLLTYALALCVAATFVCGVLPVFVRRDPGASAASTRFDAHSPTEGNLRVTFVVLQVALAMALTIAAGLVFRSYVMLVNEPTGFDASNLLYVDASEAITLGTNDTQNALNVARFMRRIAATPGIASAAGAISVPFTESRNETVFDIPGKPQSQDLIVINGTTPGYFSTMRIPILSGRDFSSRDSATSMPVAIVSRAFAYKYFGTESVIGESVIPGDGPTRKYRIIGVAGDVRSSFSMPPEPEGYVPLSQLPWIDAVLVRTTTPVAAPTRALQRVIEESNPDAVPPAVTPFGQLFAQDAMRARITTQLFAMLACIALVLALSGIYAVCAYGVERRTHEFGVRVATGAPRSAILTDVLRRAFVQSIAGIALGTILAAATTRLLATMLYRTSPKDAATFVVVALLLIACTTCAALLPALHATRVNPVVALRYE